MTKHTDEFLQCAEPMTPKLNPYWKSQPVTYKVNTEWKSELNLWTKTILTRGSGFLMAWTNWPHTWSTRSTTTSRRPLQRRRKYFAFASRSKAEAKPRRPSTTCSPSRTFPILERTWIDIEPGAQVDQAYPVAKRLNTLLRHGELPREEDGAIELWRLKDDLRNKFWVVSILVWWCVEEHDGRRRRQQ